MKLELDVWYELWERAGSQGLDTWHDHADAGSVGVVEAKSPASAGGVEPRGERSGGHEQTV